MLHYAAALLFIALIAVLFDFGGTATAVVIAAAVLSLIFLMLTLTNLLFRSINKAYPNSPRLPHILLALTNPPLPSFVGKLILKKSSPNTSVKPVRPLHQS
jgi:uncharacterized membrane protein YtjA (UPF0391 family)